MTKRVLLIRHGDEPTDDRVYTYLAGHGYAPDVRRAFAGDVLDCGPDLAGCVVYGGPYNVYDTDLHPFLQDEYRVIAHCLAQDIPLLRHLPGRADDCLAPRRHGRADAGRGP